jgi:hypothetical protein
MRVLEFVKNWTRTELSGIILQIFPREGLAKESIVSEAKCPI